MTAPITPNQVPTTQVLPTSITPCQQIVTELGVENALLRGHLFLTASALKGYLDSKHSPTEEGLQLTVPEALREKAVDALVRADGMLKDKGRGR